MLNSAKNAQCEHDKKRAASEDDEQARMAMKYTRIMMTIDFKHYLVRRYADAGISRTKHISYLIVKIMSWFAHEYIVRSMRFFRSFALFSEYLLMYSTWFFDLQTEFILLLQRWAGKNVKHIFDGFY